jgi:hypothetical protein
MMVGYHDGKLALYLARGAGQAARNQGLLSENSQAAPARRRSWQTEVSSSAREEGTGFERRED